MPTYGCKAPFTRHKIPLTPIPLGTTNVLASDKVLSCALW
jgi:hypothetical protein